MFTNGLVVWQASISMVELVAIIQQTFSYNMEDKIIPQIIVVVSIFAVFYFLLHIAYAIS